MRDVARTLQSLQQGGHQRRVGLRHCLVFSEGGDWPVGISETTNLLIGMKVTKFPVKSKIISTMPRFAIILLFAFLSNFTATAQSPWRYSFGAGILGCGRILNFKDTRLNATEKNQLQTLETIKPGYMASIGLEKQIRENIRLGFHVGYQYSGFGSKTYTVPDSVHNSTPQSARGRDSYIIHRMFLTTSLSKTIFSNQKSSVFLSGGLTLFYNPRFVHRVYAINSDGSTGIISTTEKPLPEFPKLDIALNVGAGYERKLGQNTALSIVPNLRYFVRPYPTRGDKVLYDYLYLKKKTTGHLYTFGLEARFTKNIANPYYTARRSNKLPINPPARSNGLSLALGTNVAYLCSKQSTGGPGAYLSATVTKSRLQFGLALSAYSIDKQDSDWYVVSDLENKFFLNTIQSRVSIGYDVLNHSKISLAPLAGFVLDRRNINTLGTYETKPGTDELVGFTYKNQIRYSSGALLGTQGHLVLSRHLNLDLWSHLQCFPGKKAANIENALLKGSVWLTGVGLAYLW